LEKDAAPAFTPERTGEALLRPLFDGSVSEAEQDAAEVADALALLLHEEADLRGIDR
jgi:hypothetical protein